MGTPWGLTTEQRFWLKVQKTAACWLWTAAKTQGGYGMFGHDNKAQKTTQAHRWSYEYHVGPIPAGMQIDHLCRTRECVNPDHLEPVTCRENLRRARAARAERRSERAA